MTWLKRLLAGCWLNHGDVIRSRDEHGQLTLVCSHCGVGTDLLTSKVVRGPKHDADRVLGTPQLKRVAHVSKPQKSLPENVTEFTRTSER